MGRGKKHRQGRGPKGGVLSDHKQVGKRLIPPMMQIPGMQTFSYVDSLLPHWVWLSALFLRCDDRLAVEQTIDFLRMCHDVVARKNAPCLAHFENFLRLSEEERQLIRRKAEDVGYRGFLVASLAHQNRLLVGYPLSFLFDQAQETEERESDIDLLTEDVAALLDRYSHHATKVQTTAFFAQMATGKMHISRSIELPDFDAIFVQPESEEANRVASFVRANMNAQIFQRDQNDHADWAKQFWNQAYRLRPCL